MDWKKAGAVTVLFATFGTAGLKGQAQGVLVRTYSNCCLPAEELRQAQARAAAVLADADIAVTWLNCWDGDREAAGASPRCRASVGGDLVLRLQRATTGSSDRYVSLGFSLVVPDGVPFLATVYADLVESVARRANVDATTVLGRAIAHEIGHLLLNTNSHPEAGLMRAGWSQKELRRNAADDWRFLGVERTKMQASIAARQRIGE